MTEANKTQPMRPIFWRVLVKPKSSVTMSKGGIALPEDTQESQNVLNYIGQVVDMGMLAFTHKRLEGEGNLPKVGDWVVYGRYAGQPMKYKDERYIVINDDEILGIVSDPDNFKIYV